jgi:menaquinone-dependent protoporphyrinogen oxidase
LAARDGRRSMVCRPRRAKEVTMHVLVAYASRHGSTGEIAERIADTLRNSGLYVDLREVASVTETRDYDAFVIGSAAYMHHWMKEATAFVRHNRTVLAQKPVWLFSSGPIGPDPVDSKGVDLKVASIPAELPELRDAIGPVDFRVFFGAMERGRKPIGLAERVADMIPVARDNMPYGDFRDWSEIEAWATSIAHDLTPVVVG